MRKNPLSPLYQGEANTPSLTKGKDGGRILQHLSQRAAAALQKNFAAPQRYGTAFHLTPPVADVRQLTIASRSAEHDTTAWDTLAAADQRRLKALDPTDVYLTWQLTHPNQTSFKLIHLPANTTADLTIHAAGVYWIILEHGSTLQLTDLLLDQPINLHRVFVWQKSGSRFNFWGLRTCSSFLNEKVQVELLEPDAQATITHLVVGQKKEQADITVNTYHRAPRTQSRLQVRSAAAGSSVTIYSGLIDVAQTAHDAAGHQASRSLLLSPTAVADTLPRLEIRTNDVQASHGVTTTHLDETALHYMRSRGLPESVARQLAITGFFHHQLRLPEIVADRLKRTLTAL